MIFANPAYDVTHNKGQPPAVGSQYESVRKPWSLIGRYHADPVLDVIYAPIGPRLLVTVGHIGAFLGQQIDMQGSIYTVTAFQPSTYSQVGVPGSGSPGVTYSVDATYVTVDKDIPQWFRRFKTADIPNVGLQSLLLHIGGGHGGQVANDVEGWPTCVVEPDYNTSMGVRWSIQKCDSIGTLTNFPPNPVQPDPPPWFSATAFFRAYNDPQGHPECASPKDQDSGSPVFINCGPSSDPWVFLGCVSGPGSSQVSPYKGNVQTGVSAAMVYLDNETIRVINGEPLDVVVPPPVVKPPAKPLPVVPVMPPAATVTAFDTAIIQGMIFAESMWGQSFIIDGNKSIFVGTFNAYDKAQQIGDGGYEENIDATLVASKPQFSTYIPKNGIRISVAGQRFVAARVIEDSASWAFQLTGQHK